MSDHERPRAIDRWLKWAAVLGPITTFILGIFSGAMITYQAFKDDSMRITSLEGWKEKQDDFNRETVKAIARLKALIKDSQP